MVIGDALPPSNFSSVTTGSSAFPSVQKPAVTPHGPQRWNDLPTPVKLHSHTTSSTVCWKVFQNPNIGYITYPLQTLNCSLINLLLFHRTHCLLFYEFLCGYISVAFSSSLLFWLHIGNVVRICKTLKMGKFHAHDKKWSSSVYCSAFHLYRSIMSRLLEANFPTIPCECDQELIMFTDQKNKH